MSGIEMIAQERQRYTMKSFDDLLSEAQIAISTAKVYQIEIARTAMLTKAGALIAAKIDRLKGGT